MLNISKITKEQQQISAWAGGTTTQLAIYPVASNYANRDFIWRLSSAVVELEESNFTKLPGFDRHLMVLEGELKVVHNEHHTAVLHQYDLDSFKGSWDTVSYGRATDFNLMLKEGITGSLAHHNLAEGQRISVTLEKVSEKQGFFACFCHKGQISIEAKDKLNTLEIGELVLISYDESLTVDARNNGNKECSIITAFIEV